MARFNKTAHLRQNIDAIKIAFTLDREGREATPDEKEVLRSYSGFGGIKEVIDPLPKDGGKQTVLTPLIEELHTVLKENTDGEREYKRYFDGIKDSVLSAFYTPPVVADVIASALQRNGIEPGRVLEPSAGNGIFADSARRFAPGAEITCFEKDPATGIILKHLHPENNVRIQGYETIEPKYNGYYDLALSNIPFGDVALFDPAFSTHKDPARRQATRKLHNYFFLKSTDSIRDGGIIAFITSQGVLNSPQNRYAREYLMNNCDLVSAVRLPNDLFTATAGTEVGSDLVVLQRNTHKNTLSQRELDFIETDKLYREQINVNRLFNETTQERQAPVIATTMRLDTDPYGKPAVVYTHSGGVDGIAKDLDEKLSEDLSRHLDVERYQSNAPDAPQQKEAAGKITPGQVQQQERTVQTTAGAPGERERPAPERSWTNYPETNDYDDVFSRDRTDDLDPFWQAIEEHFEEMDRKSRLEQAIPVEEQTNGLAEQQPGYLDPDWKATPEDWQRFNSWAEGQDAVRKAEAEGFHLDMETGELIPLATAEQPAETLDISPEEPAPGYEPTPEDMAQFGAWGDERDRRFMEEHPPQPEDYGITDEMAPLRATTEPEPVTEPVQPDSFSPPGTPASQATTEPEQPRQNTPSAFPGGTLFNMDDPGILKKPVAEAPAPQVSVQQEPLITLYDLFGFSEEERSQITRPRRRKKTVRPKKAQEELPFMDWREELQHNARQRKPEKEQQEKENRERHHPAGTGPAYPVGDARLAEQQEQLRQEQERQRTEYLKPVPFKAEILPHYREGSLVSDADNRIGYLRNIDGLQPMFHPLELSEAQETKASIYVEIRDTYYHLYQNEAERLEANPALREMLNRLYDNFTDRFGRLNDKKNLDLIKMDARGTEILSLERYIDGVAHKADIFHHPVAFNPNEITEAADAHEALVASLNRYAGVNLEYMASLTGGTREGILEELRGRIYYNPDIDGYEVADKYIAGNVIEKAGRVERFLRDNPTHAPAAESLGALREAAPKPIAFDDLDFNFGERWIPGGIYEKFASHLFDTEVTITYAPNIDEYSVKAENKGRGNIKIMNQYAVDSENRKFNGIHLMKHALQNTSPDITKKVRKLIDGEMKEVKVRDSQAIQLANSRIDEIRNGFSDWLRDQSPEFKDRLAGLYNRTFNCFVRPQYDGSHQTFPGLDLKGLGIQDLYKSQKDAIWMDKMLGGGICDHEVGGGKTLIMCCGAMEKKRLGLANKVMITGLKANIHEIAKTFCTAYPNARVLYPGKEDFTPKNRERIFREIKNNDWDAVILTHEQFGKIPQSPQLQQQILQDELDSVEENLEVYKAQGNSVSRAMLKGCIRRKLNLEAKLQNITHAIETRKDDAVDFKLMGIDHIYVDESHRMKNLTFNTRHDRVAGLGNPEGSQRALNMLFAIRTIQERTGRDLGATFLSGTTISNSLTELYLLFKYLRPQELERQNLKTFDAWAAVFAKKTIDYEFSVTNEVVQKERFRYFIKVPELAAFYSEITDYRTAKDIGIDRPEKNEILYTIPPTADQREFIDRLVQFAKTGDGELLYRGKLTDNEDKAKMLIATNYSRKMSLDMRMVDPERFGDDIDNKASHAARNIASYYKKYDEYKGTQFVFSDLGTYKPNEWNIYSEIKRKLVEDHGIPAHEVRFIQEASGSENQRKKMIEDMREGKIRVLFGSTEMLGTGVNAQKRAVAAHHLDQPWRPSDLDQRNGRAVRTGNEVAKYYGDNKVDIVMYAVEKTLDAYIFNLLHNKQLFIQQLKTGNLGSRTIDEGAIDEKSGMNFSEYVAILSGNTELLERARLEKKITTLESERQAFVRGKSSSRYKLDEITEKTAKNGRLIERIGRDLENFKARVQLNEDGSYKNPIRLDGVQGGGMELIGKHLNHLDRTARTGGEPQKIGSLYGFDLLVQSEKSQKDGLDFVQNRFYVRGEGDYLYSYNHGRIAADPRLAAQNFINALSTIEPTLEKFQKENERLAKDIPTLQEVVSGTWRKEPELAALKAEFTELDRKIQLSLKPVEDSEGEPAREVSQDKGQSPDDYRQPERQAPRQGNDSQPVPQSNSQPYIPERLRHLADNSGGRVVIAGAGASPPKPDVPTHKGIKL